MKILNLYAGIGGNRKLWGNNHEITAVEINEEIAMIYKDNFPNDNIIIADAHQYLLEHYKKYDFIWTSPPCPTHSKVRKQLAIKKKKDGTLFEQNKPCYPDMTLYQEIIFLDNFFNGNYVVENVQTYYEPLIQPQKVGRHYIWANYQIENIKINANSHFSTIKEMEKAKGFELSKYKIKHRKDVILRNCVFPELGLHILNSLYN